jgi:hypothetical protein
MKDVDPHALIRQSGDRKAKAQVERCRLWWAKSRQERAGRTSSCCKAAILLFQEMEEAIVLGISISYSALRARQAVMLLTK